MLLSLTYREHIRHPPWGGEGTTVLHRESGRLMVTSSRTKPGKREIPDPNGPDHDFRTCPFDHLPSGQHTVVGQYAVHGSVRLTAKTLNLSVSTVKGQLQSLRRKFDVSSNFDLVCQAVTRGILDSTTSPYTLTGRTCLGPRPKR